MRQLPSVPQVRIKKPELIQKVKGSESVLISEIASTLHNYGNNCKSRKHFLSAVIALKRSAELLPDDPDIWCDLGASLWNYGDYKLAYDVLQRSLSMRPTVVCHGNMGLVMSSMGMLDEAELQFKESIRLNPEYMLAKWSLALFYLKTGQWDKGFEYYECRMHATGIYQYPKLLFPMWNGEDLNGKTILIHGEQGTGDRILFSRYLVWLKETYPDCRILHVTLPDCQKLMWCYRHHIEFLEMETPYRDVKADYALFLMSLAKFHKSMPDNVPPDPGFIRARVEPDKDLVLAFRKGGVLCPKTKSLKVGIRWSGNPENDSDNDRRIPFEFLLELAENPDISLYSLQVGEGSQAIRDNGAEELCLDIGNVMASKGYIGTAMTLLNLDLVVTTCTSIAHLAGSMGVPTWLLLSTNPYWIWLHEGDTSCWYPSVRIFRQSSPGNWIPPLEQVKSELKKYSRSFLEKQG
jgi:tetratricopeptide (TPR) repeat protein